METMITNHVRRKVRSRSQEISSIISTSGNMIWDRLSRCYLKPECRRVRNGSDWNYRVLWSSRWCGGVAAEPARAAEGSEEDQEQMEYLEAWKKKHERTDKEK